MTGRQCAPGAGAEAPPYLEPGALDLSLTYRFSRADEEWAGTNHDLDRERAGTNVVNRQHLFDLRLTAGLTERTSVTAGLPYLAGSWSVPLPMAPERGVRRTQRAEGFGDLSLTGKVWLLDPATHPGGNVQVGLGVKVPTGRDGVETEFPRLSGTGRTRRPADASLQPGDSGWGGLLEFAAFQDAKPVRFFVSGIYLANPREQNRTRSPASVLGGASVPAHLRFNSVPDQYQFQAGMAVCLAKGLSASLAWRVDGVPARDRLGGNDGFRRPGYFTALVPGVSYSFGRHSLALSVPRTLVRNRQENARGEGGDATFAEYAVILSWSVRF